MSQCLFTIITCTYNAGATVERTLRSVDSQSCRDYEHLVLDGASTDATASIVASVPNERRRFVSEPDRGLYDAMNKGIAMSRGKYLIFLNAGDKFHGTDTLERLAQAASQHGNPGILYGQTVLVDNAGGNPRPRHLTAPEHLTLKSFASGMTVCHQAFVALRKIMDFYDLRYRYSADYDWCIRCLQHSRVNVYMGPEPLVDYLDEGMTTRNRYASLRERFRIMSFYYGTFPTIIRHLGFAFRFLKAKITSRKYK